MQENAGSELLQSWIARAAACAPDKPWVIIADDGQAISYGQLRDVIRRFATFLHERGFGPNDRVALLANNSIEQLLCYFGVMAAGATVCTVHVEMNRNQLDDIFARLKPKLVLYQDGLNLDDLLVQTSAPRLQIGRWDGPGADTLFAVLTCCAPGEPQRAARPDDDAVILFTSGTSAKPKGVVLSFREYLSNIDPVADGFGVTADDRIYDFRPFSWASAQLLGALVPVNRGATLVLGEKFSASRFFAHLRDHDVTIAAGNPTTINILLNGDGDAHRRNLPKLRFITSSSAPLVLEEWKRFEQKFDIPVAQGYGASEASWIAAIPGEARRLGTVGRPFAYHDLAIVDGDGRRLPAGEIGYVELGGVPDHPFRYLAEDGEVKTHNRGRIRTGDIGYLDADGFLTLTGREKELIIRGGAKISPLEIDSCLMQCAEVIEAATVGVPDAIYGEEVVSYVVTRPGAQIDAEALLRYCGTVLPAFKAPKQIVLSTSLPKSDRGKLDRKALAQHWISNQPDAKRT
ncbi:MAG TPA: AMP-binding protein [Xanthobacteraceae bacterium]|jgi:long-chain acyl-CoA synthetase|nr:AMP-binding protein [Xanthobacteraceae bacterium]